MTNRFKNKSLKARYSHFNNLLIKKESHSYNKGTEALLSDQNDSVMKLNSK